MKKLILFIAVLFAGNIFSQDSIYKWNKENIASKIEEINPLDVKYKKWDNLSGPTYIISKTEVFRIKYANGLIDTINKVPTTNSQIASQSTNPTKIYSGRASLLYKKINDVNLLLEIQKLPNSDAKNKMLREYADMIRYKRIQYLSNGLGYGIGFAVPVVITFGALVQYNSAYDPTTIIVVGALTGAAIRITGQVLTKIHKNKRLNAKQNILLMYEQLN